MMERKLSPAAAVAFVGVAVAAISWQCFALWSSGGRLLAETTATPEATTPGERHQVTLAYTVNNLGYTSTCG